MADIVIPNTLNFARARFRLIENVGVSRALYTGRTRTSELGGDRIGCSLEATPSMAAQRAALKSFAMQAGRRNRVYLYDPGYRPRGSFPATELLTNADFSQGTTGYTANSATLSASNGVLRATRTKGGTASVEIIQTQDLDVQYAPYALRSLVTAPQWPPANTIGPAISDGSQQAVDYQTARGLRTAVLVPFATNPASQYPVVAQNSAVPPGYYVDLHFASLARCALADAGPNLFTQSDALDNSDWIKIEATVSTGFTGPDGASTADEIVPSVNSALHSAYQAETVSSAAADFCIAGAFRANGYNFIRLQLSSGTGSALCLFNLSTGAIGSTGGTSGTGWANTRYFIRDLGDGWYYCAVVARKTNSETALEGILIVSNADGTSNFAGNGTSGVRVFRPTMAQSAVPVRLTTTTTTTIPNGTAQSGYGIHVKGLPVSTAGLLLAGDWVEIITSQGSELKMLTADLDSDAAGLGFLQFAPALRGTVADNAPIIVHRPMGRFISTADAIEYQDEPGIVTTSSFDFEEG